MASEHDAYETWDDGFMATPPRAPRRPTLDEWRAMSETQRNAYDASTSAYIMALDDPWLWRQLSNMRVRYLQVGDGATVSEARRQARAARWRELTTRARLLAGWLADLWAYTPVRKLALFIAMTELGLMLCLVILSHR